MDACPKCGHVQTPGTESCQRCGVIFARIRMAGQPHEAAETVSSRPAASDGALLARNTL